MARYAYHDVSLDVQPDALEVRARLAPFWSNLAFVPLKDASDKFRHHVSIRLHDALTNVPAGKPLFQAEEFSAFEDGDTLYLTDNASVFQLNLRAGCGDAYLDPSFFQKPELAQYNFWSFGLLKLLRSRSLYCLHSAGLLTPEGQGLLVIGPSGSGKSTLALGLIRRGWNYLTDDAVLLRAGSSTISAISLREHFFVDLSDVPSNSDLPLGGVVEDNSGGKRHRVLLQDSRFSPQRRYECRPEILLFSRIVDRKQSSASPMDSGAALKQLLEASGPQLFDRRTMGQHMNVLNRLLKQCVSLEFQAGLDVYHDPEIVVGLLSEQIARRS